VKYPHTAQQVQRNIPSELFYEMVAEGLISDAEQDIQEQTRSVSACRLTRRGHFLVQNTSNTNKSERITSMNMQSIY
jgi:hypothetical protein